jgi:carboxyl-terminal processing protease
MNNTRSKFYYLQPLLFAIVLAGGIFLGTRFNTPFLAQTSFIAPRVNQFNKLTDVINYVQHEYVDTVSQKKLVDMSIAKMLQDLDPHSSYIPAEELRAANEPLEGNFEGIGIEFHIQQDSIMVVAVISGGPSETAGLQPGDRIVKVDGENVAGIGIKNETVLKKLRGTGGTRVKVDIKRRGIEQLFQVTITRGKIPLYSVDVGYMINDSTGYIKISRFAATTYDEYKQAFDRLRNLGMKQLLLDLRNNPGGYLDAAVDVADEFLPKGKLVVYTKGKSRPRTAYKSTEKGEFESGKLVVIIDEGSASASEILAGALQDWDRATVLGRRSFGKGLVQEQTIFPDGSAIRLTVARYYTPTGRSIQKPYENGFNEYNNELVSRFNHGELESADSIRFSDSLVFTTPAGKKVYGGGGIMPDVFIPIDTVWNIDLINVLTNRGIVNQFAYDYVDNNRTAFARFKSAGDFNRNYSISNELLNEMIASVEKQGIKIDRTQLKNATPFLEAQLKAYMGRLLWRNEAFYPAIHSVDKTFQRAVEEILK